MDYKRLLWETISKTKWIYAWVDYFVFLFYCWLKRESVNHELVLAFIVLEKAYDSVGLPHSNQWKCMADMDINGVILRMLKEYYTDNVSYAKIDNELSVPIQVTKGLMQVCSLSPILFNIYLEKKLWIFGRRTTEEWECQSKTISACFS